MSYLWRLLCSQPCLVERFVAESKEEEGVAARAETRVCPTKGDDEDGFWASGTSITRGPRKGKTLSTLR